MLLPVSYFYRLESNYRLDNLISTIVSIASLSECRDLLAVGDERLIDFLGVQISLGECVL